MVLKELIKGLNVLNITGSDNVEISGIAYDSRKARKGYLFVCIDGTTADGHDYIPQAIENGAVAVVVQKDAKLPEEICMVRTPDTRYALAYLSDAFYGHPSGRFKLVGVTGTKGKTTVTFMIKSILESAGKKAGLVGTLGSRIGDRMLYTERTTPESFDLQSLFSEMVDEGVDSVVMEVSSQGLALHRVSCCDYEIGVFTNLTKDHIGPKEHASMDDYLEAKTRLFKMCKKGLVNNDSDYVNEIKKKAECVLLTFGIEKKSDIMAVDIVKHPQSIEFQVVTPWFSDKIKVNIPGRFSVYNALAAIGVCGMLGISGDAVKAGLEKVQVSGRAELVNTGRDFSVMIDYAHTPDSLENILNTVKDYAPGRVVSLFGCGGDRDRTKRPMMGEISGRIADLTIITSDNPRTEDPEAIVNDIEEGIKKSGGRYIRIVDRREAIRYALNNAAAGDVIVLAGKGHETYQTFKDKTIHFDEREVVAEILNECQGI
ncbi:MAG: UDP-N-acetylmuramoyl-L-alanyl-D-glutamate--2,6-diaminopimelate ligase [Ruminiclostridium sp.]|nr:UDP-N-acetylmuramoyl-L-alanyl-D-glutamate--2,6-diaminopimelate ligase [Ruminiclostridium sp.]